MKKLIVFVLLCAISVGSFAQLSSQEQRLVNLMTSGDLRELRIATQKIAQSENVSTQVLDIAAEILLRKYEHARSYEVDTVAWLAKALGFSKNRRYYQALTEVANSATSKKLRAHATKAVKKLQASTESQYQLGDVELPDGAYPATTQQERDNELLTMILSGRLSDLKTAAKEIVASNNQSQNLADACAEVLLNLYDSALEYQQDTYSWVAKSLGVNNSGRYHDALKIVYQARLKGLKKHAKKALKAHGEARGVQYKQGMMPIEVQEYL